MKCPFCGNIDSRVTDSRSTEENTVIRRRRVCESCGEKFTTYERLDTIPLTVIKRDGTREPFDRDKVLNGIMRACNKRTVGRDQIEKIVSEIETTCINSMKNEIETHEIGELVMNKLKDLDEVSYVRFASVYKRFTDIDSFMDELGKMLKERKE